MNTHDKYELPPLPEWLQEQDWDTKYPVSTMTTAMNQYARAAIEAERKRQGDLANVLAELVALIPLADTLNASASCQDLIDYFKGVIADRKRRGEPVAFLYEIASTLMSDGTYSNWSPRLSFSMPNASDGSIRNLRCLYAAPQPAEPLGQHPDDAAVDTFAAAMKAKLAKKRADGRGNWQMCTSTYLSRLLREHVEKGDPVDVANLAMMLHENGQRIEPVKVDAKASVPSDDALVDALINLEYDNYEQSFRGYKNRQADIALIRAALKLARGK